MNGHRKKVQEAKGIQKLALAILLLAAIFIDVMALNMLADLKAGNYESYYGVLIACVVVSLFGGVLSIAFPFLLLKKLREPKLRLILPESKSVVGESFKGQVVVSLSADQTPPIVATLKLFHSQSDSIEFVGISSVVWEKQVVVETFKPTGPRQCRGEFEIVLDGKPLLELQTTGSFNWELFVRSNDPKRTFGEVFEVDISF